MREDSVRITPRTMYRKNASSHASPAGSSRRSRRAFLCPVWRLPAGSPAAGSDAFPLDRPDAIRRSRFPTVTAVRPLRPWISQGFRVRVRGGGDRSRTVSGHPRKPCVFHLLQQSPTVLTLLTVVRGPFHLKREPVKPATPTAQRRARGSV